MKKLEAALSTLLLGMLTVTGCSSSNSPSMTSRAPKDYTSSSDAVSSDDPRVTHPEKHRKGITPSSKDPSPIPSTEPSAAPSTSPSPIPMPSLADCVDIEKKALADVEAGVHQQLKDALALTDKDEMKIQLTKDFTQDLPNYHNGPKTIVEFGVHVQVKRADGTALESTREKGREHLDGLASLGYQHPEGACEIVADFVDVPEIINSKTHERVREHEECDALPTNFWKAEKAN